jgi:hypothetical protein
MGAERHRAPLPGHGHRLDRPAGRLQRRATGAVPDLFDRMHQLSQQQLASLDYPTPSSDTATS